MPAGYTRRSCGTEYVFRYDIVTIEKLGKTVAATVRGDYRRAIHDLRGPPPPPPPDRGIRDRVVVHTAAAAAAAYAAYLLSAAVVAQQSHVTACPSVAPCPVRGCFPRVPSKRFVARRPRGPPRRAAGRPSRGSGGEYVCIKKITAVTTVWNEDEPSARERTPTTETEKNIYIRAIFFVFKNLKIS